jgi:UDP-N-acetyl-D-galactosamine dehydrogenase
MSASIIDESIMNFPRLETCTVAVIGLGYVGLPLAVEFAKCKPCVRTGEPLRRRVIGFDINQKRLSELRAGKDHTNETTAEELQAAVLLEFTADPTHLAQADVFVVTVPTPIDSAKRPDLSPLEKASAVVGSALQARALQKVATIPLVIYESTVYPGATEEVCVPILEKESGLRFNEEFCCGYSPERINPGDPDHDLTTITKVTSGSKPEAAAWIDALYTSIISAGTYQATSMKVAEAAKVIENTQRDLNIALINELAIIFRKMNIDTLDVLEAAGTKWNFLPFRPGLVGGHCIGVDPYYLTHKAEQLGYHSQVVLAGRRINDGMGRWLSEQVVLRLAQLRLPTVGMKALILGFTFKENCPDLRNTKVVDLVCGLESYGMDVEIVDPLGDPEIAQKEYGLTLHRDMNANTTYGLVVLAVAHSQFVEMPVKTWRNLLGINGLIFDLKGIVPKSLDPMRP